MEQNITLQSLCRQTVLGEYTKPINESVNDTKVLEEKKKAKKAAKPAKRSAYCDEVDSYSESVSTKNVFSDIMKTLKEEYGMGENDDTFAYDAASEDEFDQNEGESMEGDTVSVSRAELQQIQDIVTRLLGGGFEEEGFEDESFEDELNAESYAFGSTSNHIGGQGDDSKKASPLPETDLVDSQGNTRRDKAKVANTKPKRKPSKTGEIGSQGNYDSKARSASPTNHVKSNGDVNFGTNKTGYGRGKGEDIY